MLENVDNVSERAQAGALKVLRMLGTREEATMLLGVKDEYYAQKIYDGHMKMSHRIYDRIMHPEMIIESENKGE